MQHSEEPNKEIAKKDNVGSNKLIALSKLANP